VLANPLVDLWRVALDPAEEGGGIDCDATFPHHLRQVAVANPVLTVPAHAQKDDLNRKAAALEQRQSGAPYIPTLVRPPKLMQRSPFSTPPRLGPGSRPGEWEQEGLGSEVASQDLIRRCGSPAQEPPLAINFTVTCRSLVKPPKIGDGLVVPRGNRFIDLDGDDGELKVPAAVSLQEPGSR
jgi:hypothetical protein